MKNIFPFIAASFFLFLLCTLLFPSFVSADTKLVTPFHEGTQLITPTPIPTIKDDGSVVNTLASVTSFALTLGNTVHINNPQTGFSGGELPHFTISIPTKTAQDIGSMKNSVWKTGNEFLEGYLINTTTQTKYPVTIKKTGEGIFTVTASPNDHLQPGSYQLILSAKETFLYTRDLTQDFSWGVLTVNTNKSVYALNEKASLYFGIVDDHGHTLCKAKIEAVITSPSGTKTNISTEDGTIVRNSKCAGDSYINTPDYFAEYQTSLAGVYQIEVTGTNNNGTHTITDYFIVRNESPFTIDRSTFPSRIYPVAQYPVSIKITANEDYNGIVSDSIPQAVKTTNISNDGVASLSLPDATTPGSQGISQTDENAYGKITNKSVELYQQTTTTEALLQKQSNTIVWHVDWKKGQTYTLSYVLNFPPKSPEFYLLGPFTIGSLSNNEPSLQAAFNQNSLATEENGDTTINMQGIVFQEVRQWQVAGDATICWTAASAGNWSTGANWSGGVAPGSADIATFDVAGATCGTGTNSNSTIDGSFGGTVAGINIKSTYSGTITQAVALTVGTSNYAQAAGTFTGATQAITFSGTYTLSGGTFTATSGTITMNGSTWNTTGGTFSANGGLVDFEGGTIAITPSSENYNNVKFNDPCNFGTYNLATGTTLTVTGTLTLANQTGGCNGPIINGSGGISAQGNITLSQTNGTVKGSAVVTINGTGSQTITGVSSGTTGQGSIPSININKASGTLSFANTITETNNWTWTAGTVSYGTSTIFFGGSQASSITITPGATAFNNVAFDDACNNNVYTIASGTTLTVAGTLTFTNRSGCNGPTINGTGGISAQGDISLTQTVGKLVGTVVVTVNGTGTQTMTGISSGTVKQGSVPSININKSSGTFNVRNNVTESTNWTWTAGTVDYTGSTVFFQASTNGSSSITPGSTAFNNVVFDDVDCNFATYTVGSTFTVGGNLTLQDTGGGCNGPKIVGAGTLVAQANLTTSSPDLGGGTIPITLSGSANQTITQNATKIFPSGAFTINKSGGTATLATALSVNASGQTFTMSGGTFDLAGFNLTVNNAFSQSSGTIKLQGGETITTGSSSITGGTDNYYGTSTYTSLALGNTYYNLTISGSGTFTPASATTVNGSFSQTAGTFNAPTNLTVGGSITVSSATFNQGSNTITLVDNTQTTTITGLTSMYNLTSIIAGKTIDFNAGSTFTISNALTLRGNATSSVLLRSTSNGVQWNLTIPAAGSTTLSYLDVKDSNACSSTTVPISASSSTNSGNNNCWSFPGNNWYNSNWSSRTRIALNHTKVPADQTNFPVLISWASNSGLSSGAQSNGNDILFTSNDGVTKLNHEIEKYVSGTGELEAWVQIPTLSSTADTVIYMYYGNTTATNQQNVNGTWDSNYLAVWHFGDNAANTTVKDSTNNTNTGTSVANTSAMTTTGQIDGGFNFNGSTDHITVTNTSAMQFTSSQSYTISAWVNASSLPGAWSTIISHSRNTAPWYGLWISSANNWAFGGGGGGGANIQGSAASTGWHYIVGVQQGSVIRTLYVDGQSNATGSVQDASGNGNIIIGDDGVPEQWSGKIDEVRLSNTNRSANWIQTEYNNQSSPSTFITLSSSQTTPLVQIRGGVKITGGTKIKSN